MPLLSKNDGYEKYKHMRDSQLDRSEIKPWVTKCTSILLSTSYVYAYSGEKDAVNRSWEGKKPNSQAHALLTVAMMVGYEI